MNKITVNLSGDTKIQAILYGNAKLQAQLAGGVVPYRPPSNYGLITFTAADPTAANIKVS